MMSERKWMNRLTPVAGGIALALVLIASAVAHADGITVCESCTQRMWARANSDPNICNRTFTPEEGGPQARQGCINNYVRAQCWDTGICPDDSAAPGGTATCTGVFTNSECENKAGGICTNATWGLNCSANTSKTCKDVQYYPTSLVSACNVTCGCQ